MLQTFIYINVFLAGAAIALAAWFAYAHFSSKKEPKGRQIRQTDDLPQMPATTSRELLHRAEAKFQAVIDHAAGELQYDLKDTSDAVSGRLKTLGESISDAEMHRYKSSLQEIRAKTEHTFEVAAEEVTKHQEELHAALDKRRQELEHALEQDIALEKQRFIDMVDKKLAGAMTAFLLETLGHDVDLGAQSGYLLKTLEEHKAEIIKELNDGL